MNKEIEPHMLEKMLYWLTRPTITAYSKLMLDLDIDQTAALPAGPKILAANHPSVSDPFLVIMAARHQVSILIAEEVFKVKPFGTYLARSGHIPVIPGRGQEAIDQAMRLLDKGRTVLIFPEGAISPRGGGFHQPRTGVARLALASGAPVIPIGLHLEEQKITQLVSRSGDKDVVGYWYLKGPYSITIGHPMSFQGDVEDRELVRGVSRKVMDKIILLARQSERRMRGISHLPALPSEI